MVRDPPATHLGLDVTGYYFGPLWAEVSNAGAVLAGSRVVSAAAFPRARYSVHVDRDVPGCAPSVTNYGSGVTAHAQPLSGDATGVDVGIEDSADETPILDQFCLVVTC